MGNLGLINFSVWCILMVSVLIDSQVQSDNSCDIKISETLRTLLYPEENDSMQVQALRRELLRKLQQDLGLAELEDDRNYHRAWAKIAASNNYPEEYKRNVEALARSGTWYKNPPDLDTADPNYKRSIANMLAKNQELLSREAQKRGIQALARNGDLHPQMQNYQQMYERGPDSKRSISSIAKNGDLIYAYGGKRNVQSLARNGGIGKRSIDDNNEIAEDKRNIQALKAQQRNKRQADYFSNEMVYQIPKDYDDYLQDIITAEEIFPVEDKRFLGRIPQMGKPKTTAIPKSIIRYRY